MAEKQEGRWLMLTRGSESGRTPMSHIKKALVDKLEVPDFKN